MTKPFGSPDEAFQVARDASGLVAHAWTRLMLYDRHAPTAGSPDVVAAVQIGRGPHIGLASLSAEDIERLRDFCKARGLVYEIFCELRNNEAEITIHKKSRGGDCRF